MPINRQNFQELVVTYLIQLQLLHLNHLKLSWQSSALALQRSLWLRLVSIAMTFQSGRICWLCKGFWLHQHIHGQCWPEKVFPAQLLLAGPQKERKGLAPDHIHYHHHSNNLHLVLFPFPTLPLIALQSPCQSTTRGQKWLEMENFNCAAELEVSELSLY
jgi:hypothetical protein